MIKMSASLVMLSMTHEMVHAATVLAVHIGTSLTTLPVVRQHGFDMAIKMNQLYKSVASTFYQSY